MRFLSGAAAFAVIAAMLSGCGRNGILVVPTVPPDSGSHAAESTVSDTTQSTDPTEITVPQVSLPTNNTSAPTSPPTDPTETLPATPTVPPVSEPSAPTVPKETIPATPTQPSVPSLPPETTPPPETTEAAGSSVRHDPYNVASYSISDAEQALLDQIHAMRTQKQLPLLTTDKQLCALAYLRAYESTIQFSHLRPDGNSYTAIFGSYGYLCTNSGENILKAENWYPANYILEDWLFTQMTADTLTNSRFTHLGVGIYEKDGYIYVVCLLAEK